MGLHISHMRSFPEEDRSLYVYLLDYGWPEGDYETIFRNSFSAMARRASETGSIIFSSSNGIHFANEVLNWHHVNGLPAESVLPAILFTKTHPNYFVESYHEERSAENGIGDVVLIPLRKVCSTPEYFSSVVESIFSDLENGLSLSSFRVSKHDPRNTQIKSSLLSRVSKKIGNSILLEPNIGGIGVDIKKLFSGTEGQSQK